MIQVTVEIVPVGVTAFTKKLLGFVIGNLGTGTEHQGDYSVHVVDLDRGELTRAFRIDGIPRQGQQSLCELIATAILEYLRRMFGDEAAQECLERIRTIFDLNLDNVGKPRKTKKKPTGGSSKSRLSGVGSRK